MAKDQETQEFLENQNQDLQCKLDSGQVPEEKVWYVEQLIDWNNQDLKNL